VQRSNPQNAGENNGREIPCDLPDVSRARYLRPQIQAPKKVLDPQSKWPCKGFHRASRASLMENSSRTWLAVGAAICGVLSVIGWFAAVHAGVATPQTHEIMLSTETGNPAVRNKSLYLFVLPATQTFLFLSLFYPSIRWNRFVQKMAEKKAPFDVWQSNVGGLNLPAYCRVVSVALCTGSGISLFWLFQRVSIVLNQVTPG
jgi:hypothetical protein